MSKLLSGVLMAALVAGLVTVGGSSPAQDAKTTKATKKDAKTDPKTDPKTETKVDPKAGKGGVVEVNESKDGKYRFTVRDADGKYLGGSATGYATKEDAVKAVDALKSALAAPKFEYGKKDGK